MARRNYTKNMMMTDLQIYIAGVLEQSKKADPKYFHSILDRTGRGSEWSWKPEDVHNLLVFCSKPYKPPAYLNPNPECQYFIIENKNLGWENIAVVGEDAGEVRIRKGAHAPELFQYVTSSKHTRHPVDFGNMIFGPADADPKMTVIWTAFPGRLTKYGNPADFDAALALYGDGHLVLDLKPFKGCAVKNVSYATNARKTVRRKSSSIGMSREDLLGMVKYYLGVMVKYKALTSAKKPKVYKWATQQTDTTLKAFVKQLMRGCPVA